MHWYAYLGTDHPVRLFFLEIGPPGTFIRACTTIWVPRVICTKIQVDFGTSTTVDTTASSFEM